jgi:hypothetical protein
MDKKIKVGSYWHWLRQVNREKENFQNPNYLGYKGYALHKITRVKEFETLSEIFQNIKKKHENT